MHYWANGLVHLWICSEGPLLTYDNIGHPFWIHFAATDRQRCHLFRERSKNQITQILSSVAPLSHLIINFGSTPLSSPFITLVLLHFDIFYVCFILFIAFLVFYFQKSWIFWLISLFVQPPYITQLSSRSQPPLSVSDIIFERSLSYQGTSTLDCKK